MSCSLNKSKTQGERKIKLEIDQIKVKTDRLRIKKSIKDWNNSDLDISGSFKPKSTDSNNGYD